GPALAGGLLRVALATVVLALAGLLLLARAFLGGAGLGLRLRLLWALLRTRLGDLLLRAALGAAGIRAGPLPLTLQGLLRSLAHLRVLRLLLQAGQLVARLLLLPRALQLLLQAGDVLGGRLLGARALCALAGVRVTLRLARAGVPRLVRW